MGPHSQSICNAHTVLSQALMIYEDSGWVAKQIFSPGNNACRWVVKEETTQCSPGSEKWPQLAPASPSSGLLLIFSISSNKWNFLKPSKRGAGNFLPVIYSSNFFVLMHFIFFGFFFSPLIWQFVLLRDPGKNEVQGQLRCKVSAGWALMFPPLSESTLLYPSARDFPFLPQVHTHWNEILKLSQSFLSPSSLVMLHHSQWKTGWILSS